MAKQTINTTDTVEQFRDKSNDNFDELYAVDIQQVLSQGITGAINATRYATFGADAVLSVDGVRTPMPVACTISKLYCRVYATASNSQTTTITIMKNGVATSVAVITTNTDKDTPTTNSNLVDSVSFAVGDQLSFKIEVSGTSTNITVSALLTI